jgi:hypothetical protein
MKFRFIVAAVLSCALLFQCGTKSNPTSPTTTNNNNNNNTNLGSGTFTAQIGSTAWTATSVNCVYDPTAINAAIIYGIKANTGGNNDTFLFLVDSPKVGENADSTTAIVKLYNAQKNSTGVWFTFNPFSLNFTTLTATGASGSFSFKADTCLVFCDTTNRITISGNFNVTWPVY